MRVRWRDIELPNKVICRQEVLTPEYGEFVAEPFERGFGTTIGNSLRRVLLSAIEGYAVSSVKIEDVQHEFSSIDGVVEDVSDILINIKRLRIKANPDEPIPIILKINANKKGIITGADIQTDGKVEIINKDQVIATLSTDRQFKMTLEVKRGRGYVTAEENIKEKQEIGEIPIDSIFSPVRHVSYQIENTRLGKITNYDRLILNIRTDGTISPEMAIVEASKILRKHLNPFVQYFELGEEMPVDQLEKVEDVHEPSQDTQKLMEKLDIPVEQLKLPVRPKNCFAAAGIKTVRDLVSKTEGDLLKIRNFGKNSLVEIKEELKKLDLTLGMNLQNP